MFNLKKKTKIMDGQTDKVSSEAMIREQKKKDMIIKKKIMKPLNSNVYCSLTYISTDKLYVYKQDTFSRLSKITTMEIYHFLQKSNTIQGIIDT